MAGPINRQTDRSNFKFSVFNMISHTVYLRIRMIGENKTEKMSHQKHEKRNNMGRRLLEPVKHL